jgi:hypothetical protein
MAKITRSLLTIGVCALALGLASCGRPAPTTEDATGPEPSTPVQDVMNNLMAPAMDEAFILPEILSDPEVAKTAKPEDVEAAWARVRHGAIALTEISNLMVMEGRKITKPGGTVTGEGVGDYLHGAEIEARFKANRPELLKAARGLHAAGLAAQAAAEKRDVKALLDLGVDIEVVCEGCHTKFWYPPNAAAPAAK